MQSLRSDLGGALTRIPAGHATGSGGAIIIMIIIIVLILTKCVGGVGWAKGRGQKMGVHSARLRRAPVLAPPFRPILECVTRIPAGHATGSGGRKGGARKGDIIQLTLFVMGRPQNVFDYLISVGQSRTDKFSSHEPQYLLEVACTARVPIYIYISLSLYIYIYVSMYNYIYTYSTYTHTYIYIDVYIYTNIYIYIYIERERVHTYVYIYIYMYIYIYTYILLVLPCPFAPSLECVLARGGRRKRGPGVGGHDAVVCIHSYDRARYIYIYIYIHMYVVCL